MRRLMRSRGMRKFRRNRMAMGAMGVILAYAAVFAAIIGMELFDAAYTRIADAPPVFALREGTTIRVLPAKHPGFFAHREPLQRFNDLGWHNSRLQRIFERDLESSEDYRRDMDEAALAERKIARVPLAELRERYEAFRGAFLELDDTYLERDDLLDEAAAIRAEIADLEGSSADAEEVAALREELAALQPDLERVEREFTEEVDRAEAALLELMPMPRGWDGLVYFLRTSLGSDVSGRSLASRGFYSIKVAFQIGFVVASLCVAIGTLLGAGAAFFAGWVDHVVMWIVSTLSSIPYLVLLAVFAFMFTGSAWFDNPAQRPELQLVKLYVAMGLTFWVSTCRVIRGEVMKIKELEYVQAATAIGFGRFYILLRHVIPNTVHIMFINFSLLFIGAIKSEVILSFLGLGVSGQPSWGTMISNSKDDLSNFFFWEVLTASVLLFILVLAFNIVSDALQDAFDPKHVS